MLYHNLSARQLFCHTDIQTCTANSDKKAGQKNMGQMGFKSEMGGCRLKLLAFMSAKEIEQTIIINATCVLRILIEHCFIYILTIQSSGNQLDISNCF